MDQIQNGQSPEFLKHLLTNPAAAGSNHRQELENLVQTYPQCSVFHLLLAKAVQKSDAETAAKALQSAAVHAANREVLFKLIHQPELIIAPKQESVYPPVYVEQEETVKPDASFIDKKSAEGNVFAENYPVEIINTSFIGEKHSIKENENVLLKESYLEENRSEEKPDTSFIDGKLIEEEINEEDIPSAEKPDAFFIREKPVEEEEIVAKDQSSAEKFDASFTSEKLVEDEIIEQEDPSEEKPDASFIDVKPLEEEPFSAETLSINPNTEEYILIENDLRVEDVNLNFVNEPVEELVFPVEEATVLDQQQEKEEAIIEETRPEIAPIFAAQEIDEEVYEEIIAIEDIHFEAIKTASLEIQPEPAAETKVEEPAALTIQDKAEKDMLSSIASIDYFTFNNKFGQNHTSPVGSQELAIEISAAAKAPEPDVIQAKSTNSPEEKEPETVTKYHDDKMPYTFTWWLDKTRKEHAGTYQPYVKNLKVENNGQRNLNIGPELQQQYIESIFHDKPPLELTESILPPVVEPAVKRKEDVLIERFIIEEPHIHPPSSEKLDTENKAKKSAEDADALVTETLAKIYLDQMLYHKALDTYQKLLLKFPEKSGYFASQIELIEKKIN